jgi:hypothetical protein
MQIYGERAGCGTWICPRFLWAGKSYMLWRTFVPFSESFAFRFKISYTHLEIGFVLQRCCSLTSSTMRLRLSQLLYRPFCHQLQNHKILKLPTPLHISLIHPRHKIHARHFNRTHTQNSRSRSTKSHSPSKLHSEHHTSATTA